MKQIKEKERLDKVLANNGFGTRKEVRHFIRSKIVTVNGLVVTDPDSHVNINEDKIAINGVSIETEGHVYYMMNKKEGYVCSTRGGMHPCVYDLLKDEDKSKRLGGEVSAVGRLDVDTEGLLIFTSDGDLNHRLTSPKWKIPKTYLVFLRDSVDEVHMASYVNDLKKGVHIARDGKNEEADCLPASLVWKDKNLYRNKNGDVPEAVGELTVYEGKFHEVKRLFLALGNEVVYLKRLSVNNLFLDEKLNEGEYRRLTEEELKILSDLSE